MKLVKKFREKAARKAAAKDRDRVEKQLNELADKLPAEIESAHVKINAWKEAGLDRPQSVGIGGMTLPICRDAVKMLNIEGLENYDPTTLTGYKRIHEICSKADVHMSVMKLGAVPFNTVFFDFDRGYNSSSDANFFGLKRPEVGQLKLPGF